jgi:hypothetical protein
MPLLERLLRAICAVRAVVWAWAESATARLRQWLRSQTQQAQSSLDQPSPHHTPERRVMASLFPQPYFTGTPLGVLEFYRAGTLTAEPVFLDEAGTVSVTRVVADTNGRFAPIWISPAVEYRCIEKTAGGEVVADIDPITGPSSIAPADTSIYAFPETYGAIGDGVADDTAALLQAIASGLPVYLPPTKIYKTTAPLIFTQDFHSLSGPGKLQPEGNFDAIRVTGGCIGVTLEMTVISDAHTGTVLRVDNADRVTVKRMYFITGGSALHVQRCNTFVMEWGWGFSPIKGITWYGNDTIRSDIFHCIFWVHDGGPTGGYGFDWNGNCHSLQISQMGLIRGKGMIIRNTDGVTTFPAIARLYNFATDYSTEHGIDIETIVDFDMVGVYLLGSVKSGIRVGATVNSYNVRMTGGKSVGNGRYGIENLSTGPVLIAGGEQFSANTLGDFFGNVWQFARRLLIGDDFHYVDTVSSNPIHSWDTNDSTQYNRSTNTLFDTIGGVNVFDRAPLRCSFGVPARLKSYTVAALPPINFAGDTAFATDGRKSGEGAGLGTGVLVFSDGTGWRACDTGAAVSA